jgi:NAD(P)-dependent dehydrogenase (short-subunit alcohol dehydrogenase family)/acyl carrier protein
VLIHAATGGVGLAALEVARRAGAQIYATAGSPEKRAYLRSLGVEHVYDSRTLDFTDEVLVDTGGRGVDLVLNSLAGDAIAASLRALAPRGRFLEIGKRDIYDNSQLGLSPFRKNLSFFALDLARMVEEDRAEVAELFQTVVRLLETHELAPLPVTSYPVADAADAFRLMAQARHIGKLVVRLAGEPVELITSGALVIRQDASYLITGGLGALGLETARWLARRGARHLALLGRGEPSPAAREAISQLEAAGVRVLVLRCDVANADDVAATLDVVDATLPPLRGVFHAAGLLADATLLQLDRGRLADALAPKVAGAWNLHRQTIGRPLDCFVLFSSVAAILGLPGQANYAAANAFLDALAHQRRAAGLPALSVNWAPWAGVGLAAAAANRGARLEAQGLESLDPARGFAALERLLEQGATNVAVLRLDIARWAAANPGAVTPFFDQLREGGAVDTTAPGLREALLAAAPDRRLPLLEEFVREQLTEVLRLTPDRLAAGTSLKSLGLDSLMALELRNRLEAGSGLVLSATLAWNYPTIAALTEHLATRLEIPLDVQEPIGTSVPASDELAALSQQEVAVLLEDELDAIAKLLGTD